MKKQTALKSIELMPDQFELDDLIEKLVLAEKIERGRLEVQQGNTVSHEEAKEHLAKWLK